MIDFTKPVTTKGGRKVRILCTDGPNKYYPVIGLLEGEDVVETWTLDGQYLTHEEEGHNLDLVNTPAIALETAAEMAAKSLRELGWAVLMVPPEKLKGVHPHRVEIELGSALKTCLALYGRQPVEPLNLGAEHV